MTNRNLIKDYAIGARVALTTARQQTNPVLAEAYRITARKFIAEGKQYRAMKRQADMFHHLFDLASGGRG